MTDGTIVERQVLKYLDNDATFAQFPSGTCLILKPVANLEETIKGAMVEARRIPDFKVYEMEEHDYLVSFATPLMVYVGKEEFESRRKEIQRRFRELHFPSESLRSLESEQDSSHVLVGLYARGKLQRDAWQSTYRITNPV